MARAEVAPVRIFGRRLLALVSVALIAACIDPPSLESEPPFEDAGPDGGQDFAPDDAGPQCTLLLPDGGAIPWECPENRAPGVELENALLCDALLERTCGSEGGPRCDDAPACVAAQLIAKHEAQRCAEAYEDPQRYPACHFGACQELARKACGGEEPVEACEEASGCVLAQELLAQAEGDDPDEAEEARRSCQAALEDDVVFARCPLAP